MNDDYDFDVGYQSSVSDAISSNSSAKPKFEEYMEHEHENINSAKQPYGSPFESVMGEVEEWDKEQQEQIQQQVELFAEHEQRVEQEYQRQLDEHRETERELAQLAELFYTEHGAEQSELYEQAEIEHQWHLDTYVGELELWDEQAAEEHAKQVELQAEHDQRVHQEYQQQLEQHLRRQRRQQRQQQWVQQRERDTLAAMHHDQLLREIQELEDEGEDHLQQLGQLYYEQEAGAEEYLQAMEQQRQLDNDHSPPPPPSSDPMRPDSTCVICFEFIADTVLIPCGHLVACADCCDLIGVKRRGERGAGRVRCPVCRSAVMDRVRVFRS